MFTRFTRCRYTRCIMSDGFKVGYTVKDEHGDVWGRCRDQVVGPYSNDMSAAAAMFGWPRALKMEWAGEGDGGCYTIPKK